MLFEAVLTLLSLIIFLYLHFAICMLELRVRAGACDEPRHRKLVLEIIDRLSMAGRPRSARFIDEQHANAIVVRSARIKLNNESDRAVGDK